MLTTPKTNGKKSERTITESPKNTGFNASINTPVLNTLFKVYKDSRDKMTIAMRFEIIQSKTVFSLVDKMREILMGFGNGLVSFEFLSGPAISKCV